MSEKTLRKIYRKLRNIYRRLKGKKPINYTQKYRHYLLEKNKKLNKQKKVKILSEIFERKVGYKPDFQNPKTWNEKINWLKLYYQNPLITQCCDKFAMKDYVTDLLGAEYVVPTIRTYNVPEEIDLDELPERFVIKVNWASGYVIIVKNKKEITVEEIRKKVKVWVRKHRNSYYQLFNWGYKNVPSIIYAEEYIEQVGDQVYDYKLFCYNGKCKNIFITTDRFTNKTYNWFDENFNELPFTYGNAGKTEGGVQKPKHFELMKEYAEKLAEPFPFVRVDFYEIEDKIMVGEMTFYSGGGILKFTPREWDLKLGELIELPDVSIAERNKIFKAVPQIEAFKMEDKLTYSAKRAYCEQKFFVQNNYFPNLDNPKSYNEKIVWLALNYKNPKIRILADKYEMKKYIKTKIGEQYVIPNYGIYDSVNKINYRELPKSYVIKSTSGWGSKQVKIIKNGKTVSPDIINANISSWLYPWNTYYYANLCITDEKIVPRILIEKYLGDEDVLPVDYKIYCTYGEPIFGLLDITVGLIPFLVNGIDSHFFKSTNTLV